MVFFFRIGFVILHPDFGSLENFYGIPPFGFGFDIGEPAGVNIRYTFYICNNFNGFDIWTSGKLCCESWFLHLIP
jgi:hypothetical protein